MLVRAREMPCGASPKIRWLHGRAEDVVFEPPYALITAGESLHWMDWGVVLPRFAQLLTPHGVLAIVTTEEQSVPWREGYLQIVRRFSNDPTYKPVDMIAEFEKYQLFQRQRERVTALVPLRQTIADYTAAQHARSGLSLDTMSTEQAAQFGAEIAALLAPFTQDGLLTVQVTGHMIWGRPLAGRSEGEEA